METTETKTCAHCGVEKPIADFAKTKYGGLSACCKECIKAKKRDTHAKLEQMRAQRMASQRLEEFTARELIEELKRRGYRGELTYIQKIKM